jgi:TusA-related sulfurtransferase
MTDVRISTPVTASDRVSDVLARDESLVDVFVRYAPHFAKLRNRAMRRVMARLVTVEQAARTASVPSAQLVHDLNAALGIVPQVVDTLQSDALPQGSPPPLSPQVEPAAELRHPAAAPFVELDVRDALRAGEEPFAKIMAAVSVLRDEEVLHLRTIFEPVPLFAVLGKRGFVHESRAHAADDWSAWFWRQDKRAVFPSQAPESPLPDEKAPTVWLDVRGSHPPEPMMRTLAALETLPPDHVLVQVNDRVPQLLFPLLAEGGFACEVDESAADRILVRIWRAR